MRRTFFFTQIDEPYICTTLFFHLSQTVDLVHIREQHCLHHHAVIMSLLAFMLFQVFIQINLPNNLKKCPHRIIIIDLYRWT